MCIFWGGGPGDDLPVVAVGRKGDKRGAFDVHWSFLFCFVFWFLVFCTFGRGSIAIRGKNDKKLGKQKSQMQLFHLL